MIVFGIDGPDDVAHRIGELSRNFADTRKARRDVRVMVGGLGPGSLADQSDLRKPGTDVVMQIRCDLRAKPLQRKSARQPESMRCVRHRCECNEDSGSKPPSLP